MKPSAYLKLIISFGLTAFLIWWICKDLNWGEFQNELGKVRYIILIPGLLITIIHYIIRSYRWRILLKGGEGVKVKDLFDSIMIGNFGTYLLPLRAGEFMRPLMLTIRNSQISFPSAFASVVIERFFDLAMVLTTFGVCTFYVTGFEQWVYDGARALCLLAACLAIFILGCILLPGFIKNFSARFTNLMPGNIRDKFNKLIDDVITACEPLRDLKKLTMSIILTVIVWFSTFALFYIFLFLIPSVQPTVLFSLTLSVILALAVAAPSAPGFVGVYQTACIAAFALFGGSRESALAYAVISHLLQYAVFIGYGAYLLTKDGLRLKDLIKK